MTYAIAKLLYMLETERADLAINLQMIWKTQRVIEPLQRQLLVVGEAAQGILLTPPAPYRNVTEWAKKRACWDALLAVDVPFDTELDAALISRSKLDNELAADTKNAKDDAAIDALVAAVNLAQAGYWIRANASVDAQRELNVSELRLLELAAYSGAAWVPTDREASRLIAIKEKLDLIGFE